MYQTAVSDVLELPVEIGETREVGAGETVLKICVCFFIRLAFVGDPNLRAARLPASLGLEDRESLIDALVDDVFELRGNARSI